MRFLDSCMTAYKSIADRLFLGGVALFCIGDGIVAEKSIDDETLLLVGVDVDLGQVDWPPLPTMFSTDVLCSGRLFSRLVS